MPAQIDILTPFDFIAWEAVQETKHEFADGRISAFPGVTKSHAILALKIAARVDAHLGGERCLVFASDMLAATPRSVRYPDVMVTCDERDTKDMASRSVNYPKLIVEVLSESTAAVDRGNKLDEYLSLETLDEYVLIDSRRRWALAYRREGDRWVTTVPIVAGQFELVSVGLVLDLDELYQLAGVSGESSSASELIP